MLKTLHPIAKLAICLAWLAASVTIFDARFQIACIVVPCVALVALNRTSPLTLLALSLPFILFGTGFLTTQLLFRRESDFALRVAAESVVGSAAVSAGVTLMLRAVACGMISTFFALTTDPGALVRALLANGIVRPRLGYALFAAFQLVPNLVAHAQEIRMARAMHGKRRLRRFVGPGEAAGLVVPLLAFAIRRAGRIAVAMEARGLSPTAPRTVMNTPRFRRRDALFMTAAAAILVACAVTVVA